MEVLGVNRAGRLRPCKRFLCDAKPADALRKAGMPGVVFEINFQIMSDSHLTVCVTDHGAVGDGRHVNTRAIQRAIDDAARPGGCGHVIIPPGNFVTGTLHLKSHLWLELRPGAALLGSPDIGDYDVLESGDHKDLQPFHLLVMREASQVRVSGPGRIDGNGPAFWHPEPHASGWFRELAKRPSPMIECRDCRNVIWENLEVSNSPGWTMHFKRCEDVQVRGVSIRNNLFGPNTDGLDIDGCRDVRVSDCLIEAGDDAIVLKTTPDSQSCERVTVTNCVIATRCRALKLGAHESFHDMRDVVFSNCIVRESVAIFGLYSRQGATLENVAVSNIVGHAFANPDYNQPIHIDCARSKAAQLAGTKPGRIRNVSVDNFLCHSNGRILITGEQESPVENVTLRGIQFYLRDVQDPFPGGLTAQGNQFSPATPEARAARAGVVIQNAKAFTLRDVQISWPDEVPAPFHAIWLRNVEGPRIDCPGLASSDPSISVLADGD
jgi:hypothetical protein